MRYLITSNYFMNNNWIRIGSSVPSAFLGLSSLCIINYLYPMLCKVAEVNSKNLVIICTLSYFVYAFVFLMGVFMPPNPCKSVVTNISAIYSILLVIIVLYQINKVKKKLDMMQNDDLQPDKIENHYKVNKIMGIDLEILWERYGRFQLLILSILMSSISSIFKIVILYVLDDEYTAANNCTLIYPLAHNVDFFPVFFLLLTLDEGMKKKEMDKNNLLEKEK